MAADGGSPVRATPCIVEDLEDDSPDRERLAGGAEGESGADKPEGGSAKEPIEEGGPTDEWSSSLLDN